MSEQLTAERIIELLGLKPHPTCGFVAETYRAQERIPDEALPTTYAGSRPFASVLYFMVTADAQVRLHRIRSDQMYHYYLGEPLEVLLLYPNGTGEIAIVGPDLAAGMRPQLLIPGGTFHTSRLRSISAPTGFALLGTTEWPGFESADLELADPTKLIAAYPAIRREIEEFTRTQGVAWLSSRRETVSEPTRRYEEPVRRLGYPNADHPTRDRRLEQLRRV